MSSNILRKIENNSIAIKFIDYMDKRLINPE